LGELATLGTSCPDHFLRTKIRPLLLNIDPAKPVIGALLDSLDDALADYRAGYAAYYERCKRPTSPPMRDPNAVVYLIPGIGMLTFAKKQGDRADCGGVLHQRDSTSCAAHPASTPTWDCPSRKRSISSIGCWRKRNSSGLPSRRALLADALVTGGAGGIGLAISRRLLADGACVVLADIDPEALVTAATDLAAKQFGPNVIDTVLVDVTSEVAVAAALDHVARGFGASISLSATRALPPLPPLKTLRSMCE